jgi:hypothetical protein
MYAWAVGLKPYYYPEQGAGFFGTEEPSKNAAPDEVKHVNSTLNELVIRSARSTMRAMVTALIFEQNPKLVTHWPHIVDCVVKENVDDVNNLVEYETPSFGS